MNPPLSPALWSRLSALFDAALDLPAADRATWLARIERDDGEVAQHLRELLAAHADHKTADWLERGPTAQVPPDDGASGLFPGTRIGPWVLTAALGSGGMATVWKASRADGAFQRDVALKLPLHWRPDRAASLRFERERDILARLEHPNIARLYDANVAADGTPWLAIEHVDGEPIDRWCRHQRLSTVQRLTLFIQVLDAVQYAHAHLVIHRDLKPSNILVTPQGQVKLLDFGIATFLQDQGPTTPGELTRQGGRVMTPAFAAPEQVESGPLTTATDVYAAGVVLFHLLTGARPYRTAIDTPAQLELAIVQGDIRRASEACTEDAAASAGVSLRALRSHLAGDIDTILSKTLQREPARRYESARATADDLRRHLDGLPVRAQPESAAYVWRKFAKRHRVAVSAAALALTSVVAGAAAVFWQARIADEQRTRALTAQANSMAGNAFLEDLLNDSVRAGKPIKVDDWLTRAEGMARQTFAGKPDQLAGVLWMMSQRASDWDGHERSRTLLREAVALARDPDLRDSLDCADAFTQAQLGELEQATQRLRVLFDNPKVLPTARACAGGYLAFMTAQAGRLPEAVSLQERAWGLMGDIPNVPVHQRAAMMARLALFKSQAGQGQNGDQLFAQALALLRDGGRERSQSAWVLRNEWTIALNSAGDARSAWPLALENLRISSEDAAGTPLVLYTARGLGVLALTLGRYNEAAAILDQHLADATATGAATAEMQRAIECDRSLIATRTGRVDDAAQALSRADRVPRRQTSSDRFYDQGCRLARAEHLIARGAPGEALPLIDQLLAEVGGQAPGLEFAARLLDARAHLALDDPAKALVEAMRGVELARKLQADRPHSWRTGAALLVAGSAQSTLGQQEAARDTLAQSMAQLQASVDAGHPWLLEAKAKTGPHSR